MIDDLLKKIAFPDDWKNPDWDNVGKCHDWKNHVGFFDMKTDFFDEEIHQNTFWSDLTDREKKMISSMCKDMASREIWD